MPSCGTVSCKRVLGRSTSGRDPEHEPFLAVDGKPIQTLADVEQVYEEIMADEKREKKVLLEMQAQREKKWAVLDYTKDYDKEE